VISSSGEMGFETRMTLPNPDEWRLLEGFAARTAFASSAAKLSIRGDPLWSPPFAPVLCASAAGCASVCAWQRHASGRQPFDVVLPAGRIDPPVAMVLPVSSLTRPRDVHTPQGKIARLPPLRFLAGSLPMELRCPLGRELQ